MTSRRLGRMICDRRKHLGMNQTQLAEVAGLSQGHLSRIEQGNKTPTVPTLSKLRRALGLTDGEYLTYIEAAEAARDEDDEPAPTGEAAA